MRDTCFHVPTKLLFTTEGDLNNGGIPCRSIPLCIVISRNRLM